MKSDTFYTIYLVFIIIFIIVVTIFVNNKIEKCHDKGGTYIRGTCISNDSIEVIK